MDISELTSLLDNLLIDSSKTNSSNTDSIILQIILKMHDASEIGINNIYYNYNNYYEIQKIKTSLLDQFPDLSIIDVSDNRIFIDWS